MSIATASMREELNLSTTSTALARQALSGLGLSDADIERVEVSVVLSEDAGADTPDEQTSTKTADSTSTAPFWGDSMEHASAWLLIEYVDDEGVEEASAVDLREYAEHRFSVEPPNADAIGNALKRLWDKNLTSRTQQTLGDGGGWYYTYEPSNVCRDAVETMGEPDLRRNGKTPSDWHP